MATFTERLSKLEKPEEFADWLWGSLAELYLVNGNRINHNSEIYIFELINSADDPVDALSMAYNQYVPSYNQSSFRQAIGIALRKCTKTEDPKVFNIVDDLTYLISNTKATEALDGLLETVSNKYIAENHNRILYNILSILPGLGPSDKVFDVTYNLVNSPFFDDGYIFAAIGVMIGCKPNDCLKIVDEFGEKIQRLYGAVHGIKEEETAYWEAVNQCTTKYPTVKKRIRSFSKV